MIYFLPQKVILKVSMIGQITTVQSGNVLNNQLNDSVVLNQFVFWNFTYLFFSVKIWFLPVELPCRLR